MSNLWPHDFAGQAASVSICGARGASIFTPWSSDDEPHSESEISSAAESEHDFAAAEVNAFTQGFEEGRHTVELELASEREALANLAESLDALRPEPTQALAAVLAETVERLVHQIVGEVEINPALLVRRAEAAAALVADEVAPSKLRVHPDDVGLLGGARIPTPVSGDASLCRGSVVLESASGWIEDGPAVRLERLRAELDRMGAFQ